MAGPRAARTVGGMITSVSSSLILRGVLAFIVGIVALAWPAPTALVLTLVTGVWAFSGGLFEIFSAFDRGETAGTRTMSILTGLVWIVFGAVLFGRPGVGAVSLALLFGLFNLISGSTLITRGVEIRRAGQSVHSVLHKAA